MNRARQCQPPVGGVGTGEEAAVTITYANLIEELANIVLHAPLFPGDTISHRTADECVKRGWSVRNHEGDFVPTKDGIEYLYAWIAMIAGEEPQ